MIETSLSSLQKCDTTETIEECHKCFSLSTSRMDCDCVQQLYSKKQTLTIFGGENGLVINCFLRKSHHVVYILGGGDLSLFALLVEPQIRSEKGDTHLLVDDKLLPRAA